MSRSALRDSGSTRQWRKIRERILRRDGHICQYCGQEADTVDHVIPRRLNGLDTDDNLVSSCRKCNLAKGGRFFAARRTPPTPAMFFSPKGLKSPFEQPEKNV